MAGEAEGRTVPAKFTAGYETYLSPFTFRYGSPEMRRIWSQENFWGNARQIWVTAAEVQSRLGLVTPEQLIDLKAHQQELSVERTFEIESKDTKHDVLAAIREYSEVAPIGGKILHQGMTSEDVLSNVEIMQIHESLDLTRRGLVGVLGAFGEKVEENKDIVCIGWTHLQAAEPTTLGYRLAKYAQDFLVDLQLLDTIQPMIRAKGIKGPVGTSGGFETLLEGTGVSPREHEEMIMDALGLDPVEISDQTYPRKFLFLTEVVLASVGQSLHRFALDVQLLQSSSIDEVAEPKAKKQRGSSAMPHKRNPINSENVDAITEMLPGITSSAWTTGAFVTLERTLRDSAGKRSWLPESFLIVDESLKRAEKVVKGLEIHHGAIARNLARFAPFCAAEIILAKLGEAGMDRKEGHELLAEYAEAAIDDCREGLPNPFENLVCADTRVADLIGEENAREAFSNTVIQHVGDAPERCMRFLYNELYPAIGGKTE